MRRTLPSPRAPSFHLAVACVLVVSTAPGCGSNVPNTSYIPIITADTGAATGGDIGTQDATDGDAATVTTPDSAGVKDTGGSSSDIAQPVDGGGIAPSDTAATDASAMDTGLMDTGLTDTGLTDTGMVTPKACAFDAAVGAKPESCPLGQACVATMGSCTGWVSGVCKPLIVSCPALNQPVCGCDKKTYTNPCEAQKAHVTINLGSACAVIGPAVCGGNTGKTCGADQACDIDGCTPGSAGICVKDVSAAACPDGGQQECGCDENTYPNACYRQKANVAKKHAGACPDDPTTTLCKVGPIKPALCPIGTYCQVYDTNPIACVGTGECIKLPVVCDGSNKPVCGCNGKNYTNPCLLEQAQQNIKSTGQCGATTCMEGQAGCAANAYCAVPQGQCGIKGVCINKPPATACTGVIDPVCGCDGKTYTNPSCAAVQGTVVNKKGACGP